jgi:hypothetical protein
MSEQSPQRELTALEAGLAALAPCSPGIDRDYLFYHAGRTAARGGRGVWPYTTALMAVLALGLGWIAVHRPQPLPSIDQPEPRIVYIRVDNSPSPPSAANPAHRRPTPRIPDLGEADSAQELASGIHVREQVLLMGVDALPSSQAPSSPEKRPPLDPLLGMPATILDEPGRNILKGLQELGS